MPTQETFRIRQGGAKTTLERVRAHREGKRDCRYGAPKDIQRRRLKESDPEQWLKYYLAESFPLPFSSVHKDYIQDLNYILQNGGWKSIALPRGSGKTTIALGFALFAMLTGASEYLLILSAKASQGKENAASIKTWLQHNDRLAADYPEVCEPIRFTKGIPQAMLAITANGQPTGMKWTASQIVLPLCPMVNKDGTTTPAASASAVIECDGLTGSVRGKKFDRPDGRTVRPDMCIVDDPSTAESARSPEQNRQRMQTIKADVAGLGGPGRDIRIVLPCTIIETGDLADEATNPEVTPDFLGVRHPFFFAMPDNMDAWEDYNVVRVEGLANRDGGKAATKYYKKHRDVLDKGAVVAWPDRSGDGAVNGIQWGMNQYFRLGERAFATELQNSPIPASEMIDITEPRVLACTTETPRWSVDFDSIHVVGFVDCNPRTSGLHWGVVAFGARLTAQVVAYGKHPQRGTLVPKGASEAQECALLFEGLRVLCDELRDAIIQDADGNRAKLDMVMIDGGYMFSTVQQFVQQARYPFQLAASRGRASSMYLDTGRDVVKAMKHIHLRKNFKREKYLSHNADAIREIVHRAFVAGANAPGGIGIHKGLHEAFAAHICSQRLTDKAEGQKGTLYKWGLKPGAQDHWLDCVVGCYAGAHWFGIESAGEYAARRTPKKQRRGLTTLNI